jgi:chromate transporter
VGDVTSHGDITSGSGDAARGGRPPRRDLVPFRQAVRAWFLISLQTFGGPAGQIAVMQRTLVDERRWIGQQRFLHALNYCMILPGPEAQQLAVYVGWLLNGTAGGIVAGGLFVLPGAVAMLVLSAIYVAYGSTTVVIALFSGLAPAVLAIVSQAVVRVGRRALNRPAMVGLAVAAFLALALFSVPFPIVILAAGIVGWQLGRHPNGVRGSSAQPSGTDESVTPLISDDDLHSERPSGRRTLKILVLGGLVLLGYRRGDVRWRVRGALLRRPAGRQRVPLARAGRDGARARAG